MYKLKISPEAKDDLAEIKDYISKELCNPQAAINLVSKITKKIRERETLNNYETNMQINQYSLVFITHIQANIYTDYYEYYLKCGIIEYGDTSLIF